MHSIYLASFPDVERWVILGKFKLKLCDQSHGSFFGLLPADCGTQMASNGLTHLVIMQVNEIILT